jgi:hypothetical protein
MRNAFKALGTFVTKTTKTKMKLPEKDGITFTDDAFAHGENGVIDLNKHMPENFFDRFQIGHMVEWVSELGILGIKIVKAINLRRR